MRTRLCRCLVGLVFLALAGCSKHADHNHSSGGGHTHKAPHGGMLVPLGEHAYNIELLRDASTGTLTAYVLDGHAEDFTRIAAPTIDVTVLSGGQKRVLSLKAVANSLTGETVGNTSQFEAQADWLKGSAPLNGEVAAVDIRGSKFGPAAFQLK